MEGRIIFTTKAKSFILDALDKEIRPDGCIVEKGKPNQLVPASDGANSFTENDFAGVMKGSEIYIKRDLNSIVALIDLVKKETR
jgi:hypothetical protein